MAHPPAIPLIPLTPTLAAISDLAQWLLPLGVLLIIIASIMGIRRRRRRAGKRITAREQLERTRHRTAIRGDLESLMVEIEQFAKRMGGQLDAKAVHLEQLIERAERAAQAIPSAPPPPDTQETSDTPPPRQPQHDPLTQSVYDLADQGESASQIASDLSEHVGKIELILALRQP